MNNLLQVALREFKSAIKPFSAKRRKLTEVLLAFEAGFLSIESGELHVVMRAEGSWQGRAHFSPEILRALATVPPSQNPVTISYAEGHLLVGGMTIPCSWSEAYDDTIEEAVNPSIIDFLAMDRTAARSRVGSTGLGNKIRAAKEKVERRIKRAMRELGDLEISEREIRALVEAKVLARIRLEQQELGAGPGLPLE